MTEKQQKTPPETTVQVHRKPGCQVELDVKVSASLVAEARKEALKEVGKEVVLPGFRKGKAPIELIAKKYATTVEGRWREALGNLAFTTAQRHVNIPLAPTARPRFDLKEYSLDHGAHLIFYFEAEPEVPTVDASQFTLVPSDNLTITEEQVDEALFQSRLFLAQWEPVTDRGAEEGDYIRLDMDVLKGDESPQSVFKDVRFGMTKERMAEWMRRLLTGVHAGEVREGVSEVDESATEEVKQQFSAQPVRITVRAIEKAILPELDEAFAKRMGVEDLVALRTSVRSLLESTLKTERERLHREQVNRFLLNQYSFELPSSLLRQEIAQRNNPTQGSTAAEEALRLFYLSRQIVRDAQIPVAHSEVQHQAVALAHSEGTKVDPRNISKELFSRALSQVILFKAQDYVLRTSAAAQSPAHT